MTKQFPVTSIAAMAVLFGLLTAAALNTAPDASASLFRTWTPPTAPPTSAEPAVLAGGPAQADESPSPQGVHGEPR